jgi:hypothetical protein
MGVRFEPARYQRPCLVPQLYPLWTDGFFARSEPRADRGGQRGCHSQVRASKAQLRKAADSSNGGHAAGGDCILPEMGALAGNVPLGVVALVCGRFLQFLARWTACWLVRERLCPRSRLAFFSSA